MAIYTYRSLNANGKILSGKQEAANLIELELRLNRAQLILISAKEWRQRSLVSGKKIKRSDLITFFFNLDQLTRAGVPLLACLNDLHDSAEHRFFQETIAAIIESIESGLQLSQALALHANCFDSVTISLIKVGEESGQLPDIFRHLSESLKWQDELASQTKSMLLYPAFVGGVIVALTCFLMIYLVPQLASFIKSTGQSLPWQTTLLLATSRLFVAYWYWLLALPLLLFIGGKIALRLKPEWRYHLDLLKLSLWPLGPVFRKIILARFANSFALMYRAGISILDCLAHSRQLAGNQVVAHSFDQVIHDVEAGNNLAQSFQSAGIFPPLVMRMLKVGEATGQLDQALLNVSYFYDRDVKESIKKVQVLIEPVLTLFMGVLLGWITLAVLSPIYDVISKVKM